MTTEITKRLKKSELDKIYDYFDKIVELSECQSERITSIENKINLIEANTNIIRADQIKTRNTIISLKREMLDIEERTPSSELRAIK